MIFKIYKNNCKDTILFLLCIIIIKKSFGTMNKFVLLSASAIFGFAGNTVHASAMQIHLHCSRLLRIFVTCLRKNIF